MNWTIEFKPSAEKDLKRLPQKVVQRVEEAITDLASDPRPHGYKKLKGEENKYRIRVGDFRVIYEIHEKEIVVFIVRVAHRKNVYD